MEGPRVVHSYMLHVRDAGASCCSDLRDAPNAIVLGRCFVDIWTWARRRGHGIYEASLSMA